MQSENFDKKIKDSLSQRPPGNETPEWDKMRPLLDTHMPVKEKDKRRIFLLLFFFLLLGGGAFFIFRQNSGDGKNMATSQPATGNSSQNQQIISTDRSSVNNETGSDKKSPATLPVISAETSTSHKTEQAVPDPVKRKNQNLSHLLTGKETDIDVKGKITGDTKNPDKSRATNTLQPQTLANDAPVINNEPGKESIEKSIVSGPDIKNVADQKNKEGKTGNTDPAGNSPEAKKPNENSIQDQKQKESQPNLTAGSKTKTQKRKSSFFNRILITVSAGPDLSTLGIDNAGKLKPVLGAGIGYQISEKFTIRTGFYSARKVYTAEPEDYHPPANFWAYYPNLKTIDANCKVYEIPVTVDYTLKQSKDQSWFVSAGLSSFLMKKETYDYYYKPNSSPTYITYSRTITDQNKHYFSVLDLSGGYTRNINRNLSLRAEPYVKFALGGVGYGNVRLNSGGVLFSAIIKPFAKK